MVGSLTQVEWIQALRLERFEELRLVGSLSCLSSTLRSLELDEVQQAIPFSIGSLRQLQRLVLTTCHMAPYLPETFRYLTALRELHIEDCEMFQALPESLSTCPLLEVLRVIGCLELEELLGDLGDAPALRELELRTFKGLGSLPDSLVRARRLRKLAVKDCPGVVPLSGLVDLPHLDAGSRQTVREAVEKGAWPARTYEDRW